ncbi:MAG: precorrin-6y C5,15-methyltransferase (decarboxylating) subunit CbiE [Thermoproteota archaeon]|nr:precorrin-6y C5,15-methyltransferase (decarboxylating) subunit CbiE [Thermoproteota archaeon]
MAGKLFLIGVGPGSSEYLTDIAKQRIIESHYIAGYAYTLSIIRHLLDSTWQKISEVTMDTQDDIYKNIFNRMQGNEYCTVPFTGDVNFSESEVIDRLLEIFGKDNVEMIPGISSIQVAASKAKVPLDKAAIFTFHITEDINERKIELLNAVRNRRSVILLPRPWPKSREREFMESDIALFLKSNMIQTNNLDVWVFEFLTKGNERIFRGKVSDLEERRFDSLSVMVIDQVERRTYLDFD